MKENSFIYLRGLKHAAFTVFCVEDGQKSYYDPQFNVRVPFEFFINILAYVCRKHAVL